MNRFIPIILLFICSILPIERSFAQDSEEEQIGNVHLKPIFVFNRGIDERRFWRLVRSVKKVYPLAKVAQDKLKDMESQLDNLESKRDQREHIRMVYRQIREEYTPVLLKMNYTDGRVLIRLIDRETDYTAYEIIDEFKGGLTASFWQGLGRLFGQNLKDEYGESLEDQTIEKIIRYYEAGLL